MNQTTTASQPLPANSILRRAVVEQSAAKIGIFGTGGSGKSLTATLIAIALSKTYHKGAPVVLQDTEGASDWLLPIYDIEGVELYRVKSDTFPDMKQTLREGGEMGACVFLSDSYSHPWAELQASLKARLKVKKLEFHHMQELGDLWREWVVQFLNSPLHCILAGRLAFEWENNVDEETGKMGFNKAGTKMRSEKDAGYEPHLLIEMEAVRVMDEIQQTGKKKKRISKKAGGHFLHRLHVLKDRSRVLNGKMFEFKDINDYKAGDWAKVYDALKPHFANMNIGSGGNHAIGNGRSSVSLFNGNGNSAFHTRLRDVQIALEEIEGSLVTIWPGQDAKSKEMKRVAVEFLFGTRSWTAVENKSLADLELGLSTLVLFEKDVVGGSDALTDRETCTKLLARCRDKALEEIEIQTNPALDLLPEERTLAFNGVQPK